MQPPSVQPLQPSDEVIQLRDQIQAMQCIINDISRRSVHLAAIEGTVLSVPGRPVDREKGIKTTSNGRRRKDDRHAPGRALC
ncbi:hypothetical protein N7491_010480 [Penicillium cf. griseofulvum]|nr:hypothetical protein N7491_010480 [Penicillium cf. griseofulvum]KAJ5428225.1 hypothetical protein N7445_009679 [Penicillium cf. griseofulvum]